MRLLPVLLALAALTGHPAAAAAADNRGALTVTRLRWDGRDRPLGLIQFEPRISWVVAGRGRGQKQTAYQILVATDPSKLQPGAADLWDSGKVVSDESIDVRYGGPTPLARQRGHYTVRVWDAQGSPSAFAAPSWWEMGLYDEEWEGQWVGRTRAAGETADTHDRSVTYLHKAFKLPASATRARLYASAFGVYAVSLNGRPASDDALAPGYTDYEKRVLFQTYDVTPLLRAGDNVIGVIVGGGHCTAALGGREGACGLEPPRVMLQLEITLGDGSFHKVITDETWRARSGPILSAHLYDGEHHDARRELPGWDTVMTTTDAGWGPVRQYDKKKERDLVADSGPRVSVSETLVPVRVTTPRKGVQIFDLGQNIVGWSRLTVKARAGTEITLRHAEALNADGTLATENLRTARATDSYITRGGTTESWEPRFTVHGFRYVEVAGAPAPLPRDAIVGRVVHAEMPVTGSIETSSAPLNRLLANIDWSQRGAYLGVPTTGPQRDERTGNLLEAGTAAMAACLGRDVRAFYRKWIDDVRDAQLGDGAFPETAPRVQAQPGRAAAQIAGVLVPWAQFRCYGDRTALDAHLPAMGRFLAQVRALNPTLLWQRGIGAGAADPLELGTPTDSALVATALFAHAASAYAAIARHAGPALRAEVDRHETLARGARAAFAAHFVRPDGRLTSDTQTAYAVAIATGVLDDEARARAGDEFAAALARDGRLTTGVLGSAFVLPALSIAGRDDLAYQLLLRQECPGWLCSVARGATTLWEGWDASAGAGNTSPPRSLNHFAYGSVREWIFDAVGGIALDPREPAGRHVFVKPRPGGGLRFARAWHDSAYGPWKTDWRLQDGTFRLKLSVPANAHATVTMPFAGRVTEGGKPLARAEGVKVLRDDPAGAVLAVASGEYELAVAAP